MVKHLITDNIEDLGNNFTRKWLYDGRVVVYEARSVSRPAIDTWAQAVLADTLNWPEDRPILAIHDFVSVGLTPYGRRIAEEIAGQIPKHIQGRYAVIISPGVFGNAIRLFGKGRINQILPQLESDFFFYQEPALHWLEELLP